MAEVINMKFIRSDVKYYEFAGLSTEVKQTDKVATGSLFHEVDTGDVYAYDASTSTWYKQIELGGGS